MPQTIDEGFRDRVDAGEVSTPVRKLWPAPGGAADDRPNLRTGVLAIALFD